MSRSEDILQIQMLAQRYADAVMRHDAEDWSAYWAENGEWKFAVHRYNVLYRGPIELTGDKTGYQGSKIR